MNYEVDNGFVCFEFNLVRDNQTRRWRASSAWEYCSVCEFLASSAARNSLACRTANEWMNMFHVLSFMEVNSRKKLFLLKNSSHQQWNFHTKSHGNRFSLFLHTSWLHFSFLFRPESIFTNLRNKFGPFVVFCCFQGWCGRQVVDSHNFHRSSSEQLNRGFLSSTIRQRN